MATQDKSKPRSFEHGQDLRDRTFAFTCRVVKYCERLYGRGGVGKMMVPQLINSSTSMSAMLEEARAAESDGDFISKCCIALKETRETWTRLRVCVMCSLGPLDEANALVDEASQLVAIIATVIQNKRLNMKAKWVGRGRRR